jgi:hypothetical protein
MKKIGVVALFVVLVNSHGPAKCMPTYKIKMIGKDAISTPVQDYRLFLPYVANELSGYFVAPDGSDSNPGTLLLPWRTIRKAAQMLRPGVTVYIRDGVYTESVYFDISGTETNPIRIQAYPGENPAVDGGFSIPGYGGTLLYIRGDHIYISGLEIRNSAYMGILVYGNHDVVDDMYVHHCKSSGILVSHGSHSTVQNSRVWRNSFANEYGQASSWGSGLSVARSGVAYATIRHNTVWENWGEGISSYEADQVTIENNISHDNYSTNIYISDSTNVLCQRNFIYMNPDSYVYGYGANGGIMMGDERYDPPSASITIINNVAFGNQGNFWWWQGSQGGGMKDVLIAHNTFVNGIGDPSRGRGGVIISKGDHQNVRFHSNLIQQDGDLPVIATMDQPGIVYSHNLWSKPPYSAASGPGDIIADPQLAKTGAPFAVEWFRLTASSPAIDNALSIPEVTVDYFGNPRGSSPDRGAIECFP